MQELSVNLTQSPDTLEDLKFVLKVISDIRSMSLEVEIEYMYVTLVVFLPFGMYFYL